jgi:hypothetical protein
MKSRFYCTRISRIAKTDRVEPVREKPYEAGLLIDKVLHKFQIRCDLKKLIKSLSLRLTLRVMSYYYFYLRIIKPVDM